MSRGKLICIFVVLLIILISAVVLVLYKSSLKDCKNINNKYTLKKKENNINSTYWSKYNKTHYFYINVEKLGFYSFGSNNIIRECNIYTPQPEVNKTFCTQVLSKMNRLYVLCERRIIEIMVSDIKQFKEKCSNKHTLQTFNTANDTIITDAKYDDFQNSLIFINQSFIHQFNPKESKIIIINKNNEPFPEYLESVVTLNKVIYVATKSQKIYVVSSNENKFILRDACGPEGSERIQLFNNKGHLWIGCILKGDLRLYRYESKTNSIKECLKVPSKDVVKIISFENELDILTKSGIAVYSPR